MTTTFFDPTATHDQDHDVRNWDHLSSKIGKQPNGCLFALVAPRRSGKTWALRSLENSTGGVYLDLKAVSEDAWYEQPVGHSPILVDEAGALILAEPHAFLRRCRQHKAEERSVLVAVSPREYAALRAADPRGRFLDTKDRRYLGPLTADEAVLLARRVDWAESLVHELPDFWRKSAFLLTCALFAAEEEPSLRGDQPALLRRAIEIAHDNDYVRSAVYEGLSTGQRNTLRWYSGQETSKNPDDASILRSCGLVPADDARDIIDPVLRAHFRPPLVMHHVSDVHIGPKSAGVVDQKDQSGLGSVLTQGGGPTWMREAYLGRVQQEAPHIVALTGDLVEYGGDADQLEEATRWLATLHGLALARSHPDLRDTDPRVVVVGGNHDVNWSATTLDQPVTERHAPFAARLLDHPHPDLHKPYEERRAPFVHYRDCRLSLLLLGSAEFGGQVNHAKNPDGAGFEWVDYLLKLLEAPSDEAARERLSNVLSELGVDLQLDGDKLLVQRVDPGFVAHQVLAAAGASQGEAEPLRIALLHHPLSPLPAAPEIAQYAGLTNAGQVKHALFSMAIQLVLHGHQHRGFYAEERWPAASRNPVRILAAPSLGSRERDESNGYNEVRVYREGDAALAVEIRTVRFQGAQWTPELMARFLIPGTKAEEWKIDISGEA